MMKTFSPHRVTCTVLVAMKQYFVYDVMEITDLAADLHRMFGIKACANHCLYKFIIRHVVLFSNVFKNTLKQSIMQMAKNGWLIYLQFKIIHKNIIDIGHLVYNR